MGASAPWRLAAEGGDPHGESDEATRAADPSTHLVTGRLDGADESVGSGAGSGARCLERLILRRLGLKRLRVTSDEGR